MAYTIQKIGKSLVKYFKPVRAIPPHLPGDPNPIKGGEPTSGNLDEDAKKGFRLLKFKKPVHDHVAESKERLRSGSGDLDTAVAEQPEEETKLPEKVPAQWIDLVVFLLGACKRASQKIRKKIAMESYRVAIASKAKTRIRTLGSIVNTTGHIISEKDDEAA